MKNENVGVQKREQIIKNIKKDIQYSEDLSLKNWNYN